jgi:hypothetical protein
MKVAAYWHRDQLLVVVVRMGSTMQALGKCSWIDFQRVLNDWNPRRHHLSCRIRISSLLSGVWSRTDIIESVERMGER